MGIPKITQNTLSLVRHFEGFERRAKPCPAGVLTIGYGHTLAVGGFRFDWQTIITREQANDILIDDLDRVAEQIARFVPESIVGDSFGALVSFAFNVGWPSLQSSTLMRRINRGADREDIREAFCRWCKYTDPATGKRLTAAGLLRRRKAEASMFLGEDFHKYFI